MKNYKKMYKRLVKELKRCEKEERKYLPNESTEIMNAVEAYAKNYALSWFDVIFEIEDEINGKKWHNNIMTKTDFEDWKEEISLPERIIRAKSNSKISFKDAFKAAKIKRVKK